VQHTVHISEDGKSVSHLKVPSQHQINKWRFINQVIIIIFKYLLYCMYNFSLYLTKTQCPWNLCSSDI